MHDCKKTLQSRPLERGRPSPSELIDEYSFQVTAAIEQANQEFESQRDTVPRYLSAVFTHWRGVYQGLLICETTNRSGNYRLFSRAPSSTNIPSHSSINSHTTFYKQTVYPLIIHSTLLKPGCDATQFETLSRTALALVRVICKQGSWDHNKTIHPLVALWEEIQ